MSTLAAEAGLAPERAPARLLFKSGFEGNVSIDSISGHSRGFQQLRGADISGFHWSNTQPWDARQRGCFNVIIGNGAAEDINNYLHNEIIRITGRAGSGHGARGPDAPERSAHVEVSEAESRS